MAAHKVQERVESRGEPFEVNISEIRVNPRQPRRHFSETHIQELAASIKHSGVIQPLTVRKSHPGYELIAGERRLRASKLAGLTKVPVVVRNSTDLDQLEVALVENLQRQDLNVIEEALGYDRLIKEFALSQEDVAKKVGKDRSTVTNLLRLLKLPPSIQEMIQKGELSMGHARALLAIDNARTQEKLAMQIKAQDLSVRQVETLAKSQGKPSAFTQKAQPDKKLPPNLQNLVDELQRHLGTKVEVTPKAQGGEILIKCFQTQDFHTVIKKILAK